MKILFIIMISLFFLLSANAYADADKKSCYLDSGSKFESKINPSSMSDADKELMDKHHHNMDDGHVMKKMEKNRDVIENEYQSNGFSFDEYL